MGKYLGSPCKYGHDGWRYVDAHCVTCELLRSKTKREANRSQYTAWMREWRKKNPERSAAISRRHHDKHREKRLAGSRDYKKRNRAKMTALQMKRHTAQLQRTPQWADLAAIAQVYARCEAMTKSTGIRHEVDHIIPLQGEIVSGLHVHQNLQILTCTENRKKWNRFA
ncbi:MAG: hypothetical protein ACRCZI_15725 [Cetobacterium sp.]